MIRKPRGYVGKNHEILGSDILAVLQILKLPEQVLGVEVTANLRNVTATGWYPIAFMLMLLDSIDRNIGAYGLLRTGRTVFDSSFKAQVTAAKLSAHDLLYGFDKLYRHNNRGDQIGGWRVVAFGPGTAELEKTTPHHCMMEQGILSAALAAVGCPGNVSQSQCVREGADVCTFVLTSSVSDERWVGKPNP